MLRKIIKPVMFPVMFLGFSLFLVGCPDQGSVQDGGTNVNFQPPPDASVCNPFQNQSGFTDPSYGAQGALYYAGPTDPGFNSVENYFTPNHLIQNAVLFFNQIYVPTRPFDRGFTTMTGQPIQTPDGNSLYEWFAIRFDGSLVASANFPPGYYEMGILADDGAILKVDLGNGLQNIINDDGNHPTRMGCTSTPVYLDQSMPLKYELDYNQGPRYHIALVLMMRPWVDNNADPLCGQQGNSLYFDSTQDPPAPMQAYRDLQARGWKPLESQNYLLPTGQSNPCANQPAPVISNTSVANIVQTGASVLWATDIPANSRVIFINKATGVQDETAADSNYVTSHSVNITGLTSNTVYGVTAVSTSSGGQTAQSPEVLFRTLR